MWNKITYPFLKFGHVDMRLLNNMVLWFSIELAPGLQRMKHIQLFQSHKSAFIHFRMFKTILILVDCGNIKLF